MQVLQQIHLADAGLVAEADELGESDRLVTGIVEHGSTQRAGLREERDAAAIGHLPREGCIEPHRRIGVDDTQAIRPDELNAILRADLLQPLLSLDANGSGLAKAGRDDDGGLDALLAALLHGAIDNIGGKDDDGQVNRRVDIDNVAVGAHGAECWTCRGRRGKVFPDNRWSAGCGRCRRGRCRARHWTRQRRWPWDRRSHRAAGVDAKRRQAWFFPKAFPWSLHPRKSQSRMPEGNRSSVPAVYLQVDRIVNIDISID